MEQGHNSQEAIRGYVERVLALDAEKQAVADTISDVYSEAKANGFDTKILKKAVAYAKKDASEVQEELQVLDLYLHAIGLLIPLED